MREMCQTFGITALGETVESWTLENEFLTAEVLTYGATLRRLVFGGVDVVLGYDTLSEYERNDGYVGATVGRVCNRIGGASFEPGRATAPRLPPRPPRRALPTPRAKSTNRCWRCRPAKRKNKF